MGESWQGGKGKLRKESHERGGARIGALATKKMLNAAGKGGKVEITRGAGETSMENHFGKWTFIAIRLAEGLWFRQIKSRGELFPW